ncbi:MAG: MerR family transcriptional regulator, partial [Deltaproteobacteria bacterium]|nr:MerR family transcriptional regulator [Deltaproteobacteria bacterium]
MMAQARKTTERRRRSRKATGDKAGLGQKYYYRLSEIAEKLELKKHILVHWENNFPEIEPIRIGGLGLYTDRDLEIFAEIKRLVREEGFTLKGARHKLCEKISSADPLIYGSTLASPQASEAEASEPEADEPETGQLEASEPEAGQSVAGDLEIGELVASQPETSDPEANTPSSPPVSSAPELMASNSTEPDVLDFK